MALERALRSATRDRTLSQLRRRQVRPAPRHPVQQPRCGRALPGRDAQLGAYAGRWPSLFSAFPGHRDRHPVGADDAEHSGVGSFEGISCHTHAWPKEGVDFAGKRVGIIGTGATAVQTIQEIAKTVGQLTVLQRTPNWCAPLHNGKISAEEMRDIRAHYEEIFALCSTSPGCYIHAPDPRKTLEVPPEEREAFWEKLYASPGFGIWMGNFSDMLTDRAANAAASDFIARKIRQRVKDPVVAEKLIPKNHGFGTRRVPLETGYYEVYNQPNVELVDINETPIERITPTGIKTSDAEYEFDIIIYATGFDAITGAYDRIEYAA